MANCSRMVRDNAMVTVERLPPSLFRMVPSLIPYDFHFPKMGTQMHLSGPTLRRVLPPGEYDRRLCDKAAVCCTECHHKPNDVFFAKLLWPSARALKPQVALDQQRVAISSVNSLAIDHSGHYRQCRCPVKFSIGYSGVYRSVDSGLSQSSVELTNSRS